MELANIFRKFSVSVILLLLSLSVPAEKSFAETLDDLITSLRSKDYLVQRSAVEALGGIEDQRAVDALLKFVFVKAENWKIKIKAIRLLGEIPDQKISDKLVTIFNDPFLNEECPAMKWNTAIALGQHFNRGSRAVDSLIEALNYDNLLIREAVIQSLGKIGDSRAVPFLIPELKDKNFAIRFSTIKALENIGNPQAVPFLRQVADTDNDPYIKRAVLSALENFMTY